MTQHDNIIIVSDSDTHETKIMEDRIILKYKLPPGLWRIVGRAKELTEEQWEELMPTVSGFASVIYYNYLTKAVDFRDIAEQAFATATESGMSLLRSYGIDPESNPLILIKEK